MEIKLSKTNSLVNLSNSILKKFSCQTFHNSNDEIDRILNSKGNQVCLILLDGFGKFVMEKYKKYCPFIYRHIKKEINSVYPPTTVAATTSLLSGKYPCETGYVGWNQYFKKYDQYIDVFPSKNPFTNEKINPPVTEDILKYETIIDIINKNNIFKARSFHSFDYINMSNNPIETMFEEANNLALGDNVGLGSYPQGAMLEIANGVFFENNTTTITAEGKEILKKISALLSSPKYQRYRIIVEGHTDDSQPDSNLYPSNWELSSVMASTIIRELINNGLSENRFQAVGMADIAPKNPNRNIYGEAIPINRKLNNRIVIKIEI